MLLNCWHLAVVGLRKQLVCLAGLAVATQYIGKLLYEHQVIANLLSVCPIVTAATVCVCVCVIVVLD